MEDTPVKPSKDISEGDVIQVKRTPAVYTYRVLQPLGKRVSAKLAGDYVEDITPKEEKEKIEEIKQVQKLDRPKGLGRPTKKERRKLDQVKRKGII